eukprot:Polyplicarium_translucidae@DN3388_c2_g1_i1.p2
MQLQLPPLRPTSEEDSEDWADRVEPRIRASGVSVGTLRAEATGTLGDSVGPILEGALVRRDEARSINPLQPLRRRHLLHIPPHEGRRGKEAITRRSLLLLRSGRATFRFHPTKLWYNREGTNQSSRLPRPSRSVCMSQ